MDGTTFALMDGQTGANYTTFVTSKLYSLTFSSNPLERTAALVMGTHDNNISISLYSYHPHSPFTLYNSCQFPSNGSSTYFAFYFNKNTYLITPTNSLYLLDNKCNMKQIIEQLPGTNNLRYYSTLYFSVDHVSYFYDLNSIVEIWIDGNGGATAMKKSYPPFGLDDIYTLYSISMKGQIILVAGGKNNHTMWSGATSASSPTISWTQVNEWPKSLSIGGGFFVDDRYIKTKAIYFVINKYIYLNININVLK